MFNRIVAVAALVMVLSGTAVAQAATYRVKWTQVVMRTAPRATGKVIGKLKKGHRLPIQTFVGNYARFTFFGKRIYVYKGALERVGAPAPASNPLAGLVPYLTSRAGAGTYTATANANVRQAVSVRSARVGGLRKGQRVTVQGIHKNWARISFGGKARFVVASFLRKGAPAPAPSGGPLAALVPYVSGTAGAGTYETSAPVKVRETMIHTSKVVRSLARGARVSVGGIYKNRARINLGGGKRGWVVASFLRKPRPTPTPAHPATTTRAGDGKYRVSLAAGLTIRPAPRSNQSLGKLKNGAEVVVWGVASGWARITHNRAKRYVSSRYLKRVVAPTSKRGTYTVNLGLKVRSTPSFSGSTVGELFKGNRVAVTSVRADGWAVIRFRNKSRFVRASGMTKVSSTITASPSQGAVAVSLTRYVKLTRGVTLRKDPRVSGQRITTLTFNTRVTASLHYGSYYYVAAGTRRGWVHSVGLGAQKVLLPRATGGTRLSPSLLFRAKKNTKIRQEPKLISQFLGTLNAGREVRAIRRAQVRIVFNRKIVLVQAGGRNLGWVFEADLERQVDTSAPARTDSDSNTVSKTVGSTNWVGCTVSRNAMGSQSRNRASYSSTSTLTGHLLGANRRLATLTRNFAQSLARRATDTSRLEFVGNSFDIDRRLTRAFPWIGSRAADGSILGQTLFTFVVFGFKINVNGAIFAEFDLGPSITIGTTSVEAAMTGSFKVAGSGEFELDLFIGGFGPKAELAVVELSVPATLTVGLQRINGKLGPAYATFNVAIEVSSNVKIGGFARFGVGRFSYTKTKYVFEQTLAKSTYSVLSANLVGN